jgi:hypothetical protein
MLLLAALALSAQFREGSLVSGQGCVSALSGGQVTVASASVATFNDDANQRPKQGETFFVLINVFAGEPVCDTGVFVRPGVLLPEGMAFADGDNDPLPQCFLGPPTNMVRQGGACPAAPTATRADGTILFDRVGGGGIWRIPGNQALQIQIPVVATDEMGTNPIVVPPSIIGHAEYTPFDGSNRAPLRPTVFARVFFNRPVISYPTPSTTTIEPYFAAGAGFVDNHFNAGVVRLELSRDNAAFTLIEEATLPDANFTNDLSAAFDNLDPDTPYRWRFTCRVTRNGTLVEGAPQAFRTLPAPTFPVTTNVTGAGVVDVDPAPNDDGTLTDRETVTFTAVPDAGQRVVSLRVNGVVAAGDSVVHVVAGAVDVDAVFEAVPVGEGEGEGEGEEGEGEGEGEGDEGEGEEGEGEEGEGEEGEGEEGEGEGVVDDNDSDNDSDDDDDDATSGCASASAALPGVLAVVLAVRRRRR